MPEGFYSGESQIAPQEGDVLAAEKKDFHIETNDREKAKNVAFASIVEILLQEAGSGSEDLDPKGEDKREYHARPHSEDEVLKGTRRADGVMAQHGLLDPKEQSLRDIAAAGHDVDQMGYSDRFPEFEVGPDKKIYLGLPGRRRRKIAEEAVFAALPGEEKGGGEGRIAETLAHVYQAAAAGTITVDGLKEIAGTFRNIGSVFLNEKTSVERVREVLKKTLPRFTFGSASRTVFNEEEIEELTHGNTFIENIEKPIMATLPAFDFSNLTDEQVANALPEFKNMTSEQRARYLPGVKISQGKLTKDSSPQELGVALADLKEVYRRSTSDISFIESGNKEYQETRHAELIQLFQLLAGTREPQTYTLEDGGSLSLPLNLEDVKTYYALDVMGWVRNQVNFPIWQEIDANNKIAIVESLNKADDPQALRQELLELYDFKPHIQAALERDKKMQADPLARPDKVGHYSNADILKIFEYVGVEGEVLNKLCEEAKVSVEDILSKGAVA